VLRPVLNYQDAMEPGAPVVLEDLRAGSSGTDRPLDKADPSEAGRSPNVAAEMVMDLGDVAAGFEEADIVLERDYRVGAAHQGYIEPHACTVLWDASGEITIWSSSQGHFGIRDTTAALLQVPA